MPEKTKIGMYKGKTYDEIYRNFHWEIDEKLNIGVEICDKWAGDKYRTALIHIDRDGHEQRWSYWELRNASNRFANALTGLGIERGDRVAVFLPNRPETLIAHIAVYKTGAILAPLLTLFGPMAIEYRLHSSGSRIVVTDRENLPKVLEIRERLPELETIVVVGGADHADTVDFHQCLARESRHFDVTETRNDDPALIIYTSGTTGPPKGALHGHRLLPAEVNNLGFNLDFFPQPGDLLWTHCDWGYIAGSFAALYPTLYHGYTVVNYERSGRFDAEQAFEIISRYGVTVIFAIATAMRIMMEQVPRPASRYDLSELRQIAVGGETMGPDLLEWSRRELGISFNENYGLTECDYSIANCSVLMEIREGSMGRAIPGHEVAIIDRDGSELPPDCYGEIAIRRPNPSMFLGYWNDAEATAARFSGDWFRTGDFATRDADGYFWFVGREDDVIESGGYRIGPGEVEAALKKHAAVADAAVIGVPDRIKGELVKAFITVKSGVDTSAALEQELKLFVRERLESHAYPKEIEFLRELPVGNTGKVMKRELRRMENERRDANDAEKPNDNAD